MRGNCENTGQFQTSREQKFRRLSLIFTPQKPKSSGGKARPDFNCPPTDRRTGRRGSDRQGGKSEETETRRKRQAGQTAGQSKRQRDRQVCAAIGRRDLNRQAVRRTTCPRVRRTGRETGAGNASSETRRRSERLFSHLDLKLSEVSGGSERGGAFFVSCLQICEIGLNTSFKGWFWCLLILCICLTLSKSHESSRPTVNVRYTTVW